MLWLYSDDASDCSVSAYWGDGDCASGREQPRFRHPAAIQRELGLNGLLGYRTVSSARETLVVHFRQPLQVARTRSNCQAHQHELTITWLLVNRPETVSRSPRRRHGGKSNVAHLLSRQLCILREDDACSALMQTSFQNRASVCSGCYSATVPRSNKVGVTQTLGKSRNTRTNSCATPSQHAAASPPRHQIAFGWTASDSEGTICTDFCAPSASTERT